MVGVLDDMAIFINPSGELGMTSGTQESTNWTGARVVTTPDVEWNGDPVPLGNYGGSAFFVLRQMLKKNETETSQVSIHRTDGTPEGTVVVLEAALPVKLSFTGACLWPERNLILFAGNDGVTGVEPWALWLSTPDTSSFYRADANADGRMDISDAVFILAWLFTGSLTPSCLAAANTNGDASVDISDAIYLLAHLFLGGPPPPAPFPSCGPAELPSDDAIGCATKGAECS